MTEKLLQNVVRDSRPGMSEVCVTVNGGAAHIHPDMSGIDRDKEFLAVRKGIGKSDVSHFPKMTNSC